MNVLYCDKKGYSIEYKEPNGNIVGIEQLKNGEFVIISDNLDHTFFFQHMQFFGSKDYINYERICVANDVLNLPNSSIYCVNQDASHITSNRKTSNFILYDAKRKQKKLFKMNLCNLSLLDLGENKGNDNYFFLKADYIYEMGNLERTLIPLVFTINKTRLEIVSIGSYEQSRNIPVISSDRLDYCDYEAICKNDFCVQYTIRKEILKYHELLKWYIKEQNDQDVESEKMLKDKILRSLKKGM